jgi:hypothetical protein
MLKSAIGKVMWVGRATILALLTTVALGLLLVGGVAASKQSQEEWSSSSLSPMTNKSEGDISLQSTTVRASFASGAGANFLGVEVSNHGNLVSFESPAQRESVFIEGYVLCSNGTSTVHGHDTGADERGFGRPTFTQPNAGAFPLTVTRNTTDGKFRLKQVWAKPDAKEKDVSVTMTVTNRSNSTINAVILSRVADLDVGDTSSDYGATTTDSAIQWDDDFADFDNRPTTGVTLTALSFGTQHLTFIEDININKRACSDGSSLATPVTTKADLTSRVFYNLRNIAAGASRTVRFAYGRM